MKKKMILANKQINRMNLKLMMKLANLFRILIMDLIIDIN